MNDVIDKRNFFLTLDVVNGQRIAHNAGFSIPSEEVQQGEVIDIIHKWILLSGSGIMAEVDKCIDWTMEITEEGMSEEEIADTKEVLISFSASMLSHLLDKDMVQLSPDLRMDQSNTTAFIRDLFSTVVEDLDE